MSLVAFKPIAEKLFLIPNKQGEIVPFKFNSLQNDLYKHMLNHNMLDVLKFRQGGVTTLVMVGFLITCMAKYAVCVMIAHDKDHTEKLLQRCRLLLHLMKGPKPSLKRVNDQELMFEKTHSTFYIGTAGSRSFGRSATITHLHCSEYAFWPNPEAQLAGLMQAVPHNTGVIIKESTANGFGTFHHKQYMRALAGQSKFKALFYPWYMHEEYSSSTPLSSPLTPEEQALQAQYNLTLEQIQWRREKIEEFNDSVDLFNQEYPTTIEDAFLQSGGSMFPTVTSFPSEQWQTSLVPRVGLCSLLSTHPQRDCHYVFGVDVAGGTKRDNSTIQGLCLETNEQVLAYATNTLAPPSFASVLLELGRMYNNAFLVVESNQHGLSVLDILKQSGYPYERIYKTYPSAHRVEYGFKTTATSKYKLIGVLQRVLPELKLYDTPTVEELRGFGETSLDTLGNVSAEHDDRVIALALACVGLQREQTKLDTLTPKSKQERKLPVNTNSKVVSLEDMLSRLPHRRKSTFLGDQHRREAWV
jgi:hypothetical protein